MKQITLLLLFITGLASAQMEVLEIPKGETIGALRPMGMLVAEIIQYDDYASFRYRDSQYTQITDIKSFEIPIQDNEIEDFYKMCMQVLEKQDKEPVMLTFGNQMVALRFMKMMGRKSISITQLEGNKIYGYTNWLNKKQVQKLFGKR